ncbi:MAG: hypothetical protein R6U94_06630, partial [Nitriliruptoraceae bacterium]
TTSKDIVKQDLASIIRGVILIEVFRSLFVMSTEGLSTEGLSIEGLSTEGLSTEGLSIEGLSAEGLSVAGVSAEGVSVAGLSIEGLSVAGVSTEGLSIEGLSVAGVSADGVSVEGTSAVGFSAETSPCGARVVVGARSSAAPVASEVDAMLAVEAWLTADGALTLSALADGSFAGLGACSSHSSSMTRGSTSASPEGSLDVNSIAAGCSGLPETALARPNAPAASAAAVAEAVTVRQRVRCCMGRLLARS